MLTITLAGRVGPAATMAVPVGADRADAHGEPGGDLGLPVPLPDAAAVFLRETGANGEPGHVDVLPLPGGRPHLVYFVGVGQSSPADLRRAGAALARAALNRPTQGRRLLSWVGRGASPEALRAMAEAVRLASYTFTRASGGLTTPSLREIAVVPAAGQEQAAAAALDLAAAASDATAFARDLTNTPALEKTPAWLARQAQRALTAPGMPAVTYTVRDERWLAAEGFGGIVAVGSGSARPPRLIEARYAPRGVRGPHVVLVGKGITFDTGGVSLKPNEGMKTMHTDMAGGAAVLAALAAAARLRLPVRVTALVPAAENHLSGHAYRPGDVIRHYGGRTSEIRSTDAEGRVVLADALAYAVARLRPDVLVDVATLTGAAKIALGGRTGALFATDEALAARLRAAAGAAGEALWPMPLAEDYLSLLDSPIADANNAPGNPGGITAALFLRPFAGQVPWAHLDIAGPARAAADDAELTRGATGFAVRTLLRYLEALP